MGMKHKAKKGTVIEANGVKVTVLRGSPLLEIAAKREVRITIADGFCKGRRSRDRR